MEREKRIHDKIMDLWESGKVQKQLDNLYEYDEYYANYMDDIYLDDPMCEDAFKEGKESNQ